MSRASRGTKKSRGIARKALACVTSIVLAAGLMPGSAWADGGDVTEPVTVPNGSLKYNSITIEDGNQGEKALHVGGTHNGGSATVEVTEDVKVANASDPTAIFVNEEASSSSPDATPFCASVSVGGNASASDSGYAYGVKVYLYNNGSKASVSVEKSITAEGDTARGILVECPGRSFTTVKAGSVSASGTLDASGDWTATGIHSAALQDSVVTCAIEGDVVARGVNGRGSVGIEVVGSGANTVLVGGTVKADTIGVHFESNRYENNATAETVDVTAWKVDAPIVAGTYQGNGYIEVDDLVKDINYIIKLQQPQQGTVLSLSGTKKKSVVVGDKTYNYDVANWADGDGNKVYLQAAEGWEITGGFSDKEKTVALQHDDGGWYVVVPKGGGVLLTANVVKQQFEVVFKNGEEVLQAGKVEYGDMPEYKGATPTKDPTTETVYEFSGWTPTIDKVTGNITYKALFTEKPREYEMSFDLDGGTVDGKTTFTQAVRYGDTITLPAPVRDGFEFQYWEGSRYYAGDLYKVEGPHAFKAVWKEKEPTSEPVTTKASSPAGADAMPATGDSSPVAPAFVTLLVSLCALIVSRTKLNQRYVGKHTR